MLRPPPRPGAGARRETHPRDRLIGRVLRSRRARQRQTEGRDRTQERPRRGRPRSATFAVGAGSIVAIVVATAPVPHAARARQAIRGSIVAIVATTAPVPHAARARPAIRGGRSLRAARSGWKCWSRTRRPPLLEATLTRSNFQSGQPLFRNGRPSEARAARTRPGTCAFGSRALSASSPTGRSTAEIGDRAAP